MAMLRRIMRSYAPEKAAKILAAGNAAILGEPFQPVETGGEYTGRPTRARLAVAASDGDEEQAEEQAAAWLRGLLAGDAGTSTQVFDALSAAETETSLDRVQLRQLISKAQSEVRDFEYAFRRCAALSLLPARRVRSALRLRRRRLLLLRLLLPQLPPLPQPPRRARCSSCARRRWGWRSARRRRQRSGSWTRWWASRAPPRRAAARTATRTSLEP
jgi:hypothetical protein